MEKVYSINEEDYYDYDEFVSIIEDEGKPDFIYVSDRVIQEHKDFLSIDSLFEDMQDKACELGEWAEGYLEDVSKEQKEELNKLVLNWFDKNISKPSFFLVENTKKITLEQFENIK
jgi:uncharacterized protein YeaC (DUF1315 family)